MRVRVLGPVDCIDGLGVRVQIGSPTQRLVLAMLAARLGEAVPPGRLIDAVWGAAPPRSAEQSLRTYISRLRHVLGEALASQPGGWALELPSDAVDAARFERLADEARRGGMPPADQVAMLTEALSLWRGPAFGDFTDNDEIRPVSVRLAEIRHACREARATALLEAGRAADAVAAAEELVAEQPWREPAWSTLVAALAGAGRVQDALAAYRRAHAALADVGLDPSPRLRAAQTLALEAPPAPPAPPARPATVATGPAVAPTTARWPLLRRPVTSLVGRSDDLAALVRLVVHQRVVTLLGPGGVGKTRLAYDVAGRVADEFSGGLRTVELASVIDPASVATVVAEVLDVDVSGGVERALAHAGALDVLLVVDNCEHVVDEAARVVSLLVEHGDGVHVLATSRERLGVDGEHCRDVRPLATDGVGAPAIQLFRDRARAAVDGVELDEDDETIARIVRRLDGLPLAIEMAAARLRGMSPTELAARLDDQLDVLVDARRSATPRHRTLTAVVAWSESLLAPEQSQFLGALAVFAGPVELADVVAVTGRRNALDVLTALVERSLVVADSSADRTRYGLMEIIREYARGRLVATGRLDAWAARHARHVLSAVRTADAQLRTAAEADGNRRLTELLDEVRGARLWALDHDRPLAVELTAALHLFAHSRLRVDPMRWAVELVNTWSQAPWPGVDPGAAATVYATAATWYLNTGDLVRAAELAETGVAAAAGRAERRFALETLGDVQMFSGHLVDATRLGRELVAVAREAEDQHLVVAGILNVAASVSYAGDPAAARQTLADAPAPNRLAPSDVGWLAYAEAEVLLDDDPGRCLNLLAEAVRLADAVDNRFLGGVARVTASSVSARCGDPDEAADAFVAVTRHWREQRNLTHLLTTLRNVVVLFQRLAAAVEAAQLLGAVTGERVKPSFGREAELLTAADEWVEGVLGPAEAARQRALGAGRGIDEAAQAAVEHLTALRSRRRRLAPGEAVDEA